MTRRDESGWRFTIHAHLVFVKRDALVGFQDRRPPASHTVPLANLEGHVPNLKTTFFFGNKPAPELRKCFREKRADIERLEFARFPAFHHFANLPHLGNVKRLVGEGPLLQQFADVLAIQFLINDFIQTCFYLRPVALPNCLDQDVTECGGLENLAKHVEHGSAECFAFLFQLCKQPEKDIALARLLGDQVPKVTDLALTDTMDAAKE